MKNVRTGLLLNLALLYFILFASAPTGYLFESMAFSQEETFTTVTDNRYGEGGTLTTVSDEKLKVKRAGWKDKDGNLREIYFNYKDGSESWAFFAPGNSLPKYIFNIKPIRQDGKPTYSYDGPGKSLSIGKDRAEYVNIIEAAEKQFAVNGTIPPDPFAKKGDTVDTKVEQPELPATGLSKSTSNDPCGEASLSTVEQKVPVATASSQIKCYIEHIEKRKKSMTDSYYDSGARTTLETAFKAQGITASMTYADSWGKGGIGLTWSESAKKFYDNHQGFLSQSLDVITKRGYATGTEMAYLANGMRSWDTFDANIESQFKMFVSAFTEEAKTNDEKVAAYNKFNADYSKVANTLPYNAANVSEVNAQFGRTSKPLDDKIKQIEQNEAVIKNSIASLGGTFMFSALKPDK